MSVTVDNLEEQCECGCGELSEEALEVVARRENYYSNGEEIEPHPQRELFGFTVDEALHGIISKLWIVGLPTDFSCQGQTEFLHPELMGGEDFMAQIVFLKVDDALKFYSLFTTVFGTGTEFGPEPITLRAMEGSREGIESASEITEENFEAIVARTRGEIRFHPNWLPLLDSLLEEVINEAPELDGRRALLEVAEDLDDVYEALEVDSFTRKQAELSCECGSEH